MLWRAGGLTESQKPSARSHKPQTSQPSTKVHAPGWVRPPTTPLPLKLLQCPRMPCEYFLTHRIHHTPKHPVSMTKQAQKAVLKRVPNKEGRITIRGYERIKINKMSRQWRDSFGPERKAKGSAAKKEGSE